MSARATTLRDTRHNVSTLSLSSLSLFRVLSLLSIALTKGRRLIALSLSSLSLPPDDSIFFLIFLMMTPSASLSVAQGREISSKTSELFVDLSSTMNHSTCCSVPLLEASAFLSGSSAPIPSLFRRRFELGQIKR